MGVYFKHMDMPKSCLSCDVNTDYNYCPILRRDTSDIRYDKRFDDCPIVEVKTPHGDLIDREVIKQDLSDFYKGIVTARRLIDAQDTVIEAEGES